MNKFQPSKSEKEVISIRIEINKLEKIDKIATMIGISRNQLINQCLEYSLENLDFKNVEKPKKGKNK